MVIPVKYPLDDVSKLFDSNGETASDLISHQSSSMNGSQLSNSSLSKSDNQTNTSTVE